MKFNTKLAMVWLALLACLLPLGPAANGGVVKTYSGEIGDSQCAYNVHSLTQSHEEMLHMKSAGSTAEDCVRYCVKNQGGKYVLQDKKHVYKLDDQAAAAKFAGQKVKVHGVLDTKTNIIDVESIELSSPPKPN